MNFAGFRAPQAAGDEPLPEEGSFHKRAIFRRWATWGVHRGHPAFVRYSPPIIGLAFGALLPRARHAVLRNLRRIHGPRDAVVEARDVAATFAQFAACFAEGLGGNRPEAAQGTTRVRGADRLSDILNAGRGFVIVTAHAGPWDGAARVLAEGHDLDVMMVMAEETAKDAAGIQDAARSGARVRVLRIGRHPLDVLPVIQHLQAGGVVALQLDRAPPGRAAVVGNLFDAPFPVPVGPFVLAGVARVPVIPAFAARTGFYRRAIEVGHAVWPARRNSYEHLVQYANGVLSQMETHLARYPTQWFHFLTDEEEQLALESARAHARVMMGPEVD